MTVVVVIPWRAGDPQREANLWWVRQQYKEKLPAPLVFGESPDGPFNRSAAILDGAAKVTADVYVIGDGDAWTDGVGDAVREVERGAGWAVPHLMLKRLSEESTRRVLAGADPETMRGFAERPYKGHECGTIVVVAAEVLCEAPPDVRFVGWGQEDDAWSSALRSLVGAPWRGTAPCFHLWHEPQPRLSRRAGSREGLALLHRYKRAVRDPDVMRALIDEAREVTA